MRRFVGILLVAALAAGAWYLLSPARPVQAVRGLRVRPLLLPDRLASLPLEPGDAFDVGPSGEVLFPTQVGLEVVDGDRVEVGDGALSDVLVVDRDTVLTLDGADLGQVTDGGRTTPFVTLPYDDFRLLRTGSPQVVGLFRAGRLSKLTRSGQVTVLAEVPDDLVDAASGPGGRYFLATAREVYLLDDRTLRLVLRLPTDAGQIVGLAADPETGEVFFSTRDRIYSARGGEALALVQSLGGRLRFRDGLLYVWDRPRGVLAAVEGIRRLGTSKARP